MTDNHVCLDSEHRYNCQLFQLLSIEEIEVWHYIKMLLFVFFKIVSTAVSHYHPIYLSSKESKSASKEQ